VPAEIAAKPNVLDRSNWEAKGSKYPEVQKMKKMGTRLSFITVHHSALPITETEEKAIRVLQKVHTTGNIEGEKTDYGDIAYHYLIAPSGKIYEGRSVEYQPNSNTCYVHSANVMNGPFKKKDFWYPKDSSKSGQKRDSVGEIDLWSLATKEGYSGKSRISQYLAGSNLLPKPGMIDGHLTICFLGDFRDEPYKPRSGPEPTDKAKESFSSLVRDLQGKHNPIVVKTHRECASTSCPGNGVYYWVKANFK